jgi:hypothetical protein
MSDRSRKILASFASAFEFEDFILGLVRRLDEFEDVEAWNSFDIPLDAIAKRKDHSGEPKPVILEVKRIHKDRRVTISAAKRLMECLKTIKGRPGYSAASAILITNTFPDLETRQYCEDAGIEVWDRDVLEEMIDRTDGERLSAESLVH